MAESVELMCTLRMSLQQALVGEVTSHMAAVTAGIDGTLIRIHVYFDGPVDESDIDDVQCIGTEVIAHFHHPYMIEEAWFSLQEREPAMLDFWAFKRRGL